MSTVSKSLVRLDDIYNKAQNYAIVEKRKRGGGQELTQFNPFTPYSSGTFLGNPLQGATESRYALFRGWVHAAVNALAMKGAGQILQVGKLAKDKKKEGPNPKKDFLLSRMPNSLRSKAADTELEVILDHPIQKSLDNPNSVQHRWQFTYSFIANLCLTGWAFVVSSPKEDNPDEFEFYSIPSNWVRPDHTEGAFSKFWIVNPRNPIKGEPLYRNQVSFAYLPNPGDPLGALSPAGAQLMGIKVDDFIQESQHNFFKNGIFPSVLVTVGKDPHPSVPGGIRPRLTAAQRRQVHGAIRKVMQGVENYGEPAILDGFIENVERLSATQNEMGWEKSEKTVRTRILSAFGVHPFILGEEMPGSYAQANIVENLFNDRVNTFLDMLSNMMTEFAINTAGADEDLLVWWEECVSRAPDMEKSLFEGARTRRDISQNEFRAFMNLPPDADGNEDVLAQQAITAVVTISEKVVAGTITPEQGVSILEGMGVDSKLAKKIAGKPKPKEEMPAMVPGQPVPGQPGQPGAVPPPGQPPKVGQPKPGQPGPGLGQVGKPPTPTGLGTPKEEKPPKTPKPLRPPKKDIDELVTKFTKTVDDFATDITVGAKVETISLSRIKSD